MEYTKLAKLIETKGAKILKNVKTHWIFILSPIWHVMVEYKTLLMKMALDASINEKAKVVFLKDNFDLICDV